MILVLGSSRDRVFPRLNQVLRDSGHPFLAIDEDNPGRYSAKREGANGNSIYRIFGDVCCGKTPVTAIFVRHAVARTLDPDQLQQMGRLQGELNCMLRAARCPILNPPSNGLSNYSKAYQVALLAEADFDVPRSLVTNSPETARAFLKECGGEVIYKGVSNVTTLAAHLRQSCAARTSALQSYSVSGVRRRR